MLAQKVCEKLVVDDALRHQIDAIGHGQAIAPPSQMYRTGSDNSLRVIPRPRATFGPCGLLVLTTSIGMT